MAATLAHRWRFENNALDPVGGKDGVLTGTYGTSNPKEGSYFLNSNSYLTVGSLDSIIASLTAKFTITFWARAIGSYNSPTIFQAVNTRNNDEGFVFEKGSLNYANLKIRAASGAYNYWFYNNLGNTVNEWSHYAITYDYSDPLESRPKLYVNGVLKTTYSTYLNSIDSIKTATSVFIGDNDENGQIDDFRIYDGILTLDEILLLYDNGTSSFFTELNSLKPTDQKPEVAFLKALRGLLPKGYLWGFSIGEGDSVTTIQDNISPSPYNEYQDHINDGAYLIWQNNIFSSVGLSFSTSYLGILLSCFAHEIYRLQVKLYNLYSERIPGLSIECLEDWERVTNEPDDAIVNPEALTEQQRQFRVHNKLFPTEQTTLNKQYYIDYAMVNYQVAIDIIELSDISSAFRVGSSRVGDRLNSAWQLSTISVNVLDGPYDSDIILELQNFFDKLKPSHVILVWTGI